MRRAFKISVLAACVLALTVSALSISGCGKKTASTSDETQPIVTQGQTKSQPTSGNTTNNTQQSAPKVQPISPSSDSNVNGAINAAMASARANNPSIGELSVLAVKVVDDWARVDMQPTDRSTDAATWLLKKENGSWSVVDFGTTVVPSDHPDAPAEVFQ